MINRAAQQTRQNRPDRGVHVFALLGLALLLVVPGYALSRLAPWIDWRFLVGAPIALSLVTYFGYRTDKRRAEAGEWRIPESTLHMAEFLGGWPGAFLAQRKFRHKISKTSYQVVFWMIVMTHKGCRLKNRKLRATPKQTKDENGRGLIERFT